MNLVVAELFARHWWGHTDPLYDLIMRIADQKGGTVEASEDEAGRLRVALDEIVTQDTLTDDERELMAVFVLDNGDA